MYTAGEAIEAVEHQHLDSILRQQLVGALAAIGIGVIEYAPVVGVGLLAETARIDEVALRRPESPHQVAAVLVRIEHTAGDVMLLQEIGRAHREQPFRGTQLKRSAAIIST